MGCVGSKPDDSPAVALCRKRCQFLDEAIHQRYALAEAHLAYVHSLKPVVDLLHHFLICSTPLHAVAMPFISGAQPFLIKGREILLDSQLRLLP